MRFLSINHNVVASDAGDDIIVELLEKAGIRRLIQCNNSLIDKLIQSLILFYITGLVLCCATRINT